MLPVLFQIGPVTIYTYGLMAATGFIVASLLLSRRARIEGEDPQLALDLAFYLVVSALIGSRILYVIIEYRQYVHNPLGIFKIWEGGLVFYGGFIAAALTGFWFVKKHNLHPGKFADLAAPSIAIGHAFGRVGCLGAGCCYGKVTDSPIGIVFTDPKALAPLNVPLYPTQIFSSLNELFIFLILITVRPRKKFHGQLFLLWMMLYAVGRFIIEIYRGDPRGQIGPLSTSQAVAIAAFLIAGGLMARLLRKASASKA